jgi:hypothetical protein
MQPQKASSISNQDTLNKSFTRVLSGNVSPGNGLTFDANGQPLTFSQDNMSGVIIRIGSVTNPNALPAAWTGNSTDLTIAHNMGKVPYGVFAIAKYAAADVWFGTIAATDMNITLQTDNDATDMTVLILA